ncbi:hypothetical protein J3R82DRAFT_36 [Butyriboletus roseoflavus]|nr:hypothetical protein J3R82DRAFT_36 [Butyriboletus roseoflavus]
MPSQLSSALPLSVVLQRPLSPPLAHGLACVRWSSHVIVQGTWVVAFYSVLNILTQYIFFSMPAASLVDTLPFRLGFATVTVILGGQTLASIDANSLPLVVGIVIIGVCALIPCFIGYDVVHVYERYAWMVTFFIMCCLYGLGSKAGYDVNAQKAVRRHWKSTQR